MNNRTDLQSIAVKRRFSDSWWFRVLVMAGSYIFAADFLPILLLVVVNCIGYLPYSDRPGPGWQVPHFPSSDELRFFVGFAFLLMKGTALYGSVFSLSALILGLCSLPRWALRAIATPTAFLASGLMMAAGGWLIAISSLGVWTAAGCGALWGAFVFPRLVPVTNLRLPTVVRIALPTAVMIGATYLLVRPLLPNPRLTNAKIEVVRRDDAGTDLSKIDLSFIGSSITRYTQSSAKYVSVERMEFATQGRNQVRVLFIIDDDQVMAHAFLLPRSGNAIYRQHQGKWHGERVEAQISDISLELTSYDGHAISLQVKGPCCSSMSQRIGPYQ